MKIKICSYEFEYRNLTLKKSSVTINVMLKQKLLFVRLAKEVIFGTANMGIERRRRKLRRYMLNIKTKKSQSMTGSNIEPPRKDGGENYTQLPKQERRNKFLFPPCIYNV